MGVLDQRAGFDRGADSGGNRRPCVGPTAQTGHRLPWDPGHRCGHDRFDHGHKLGRNHLRLGLSDHCRAVDRGRSGAGFLRVAGGPRRCGHPAAQAVWQPSICRVLRPVLRGRIRDAGCTDLRTDLSGVRGRRVGDRVRSAHVADGDRPADRLDRDGCPGRPDGPLQDLPGRGDGADGGLRSC